MNVIDCRSYANAAVQNLDDLALGNLSQFQDSCLFSFDVLSKEL